MENQLEKINEAITAWQNENKEKRAYIVLAIEEPQEGGDGVANTEMLGGSRASLCAALGCAFGDDNSDIGKLVKMSIEILALNTLKYALSKQAEDEEQEADSDDNNENYKN